MGLLAAGTARSALATSTTANRMAVTPAMASRIIAASVSSARGYATPAGPPPKGFRQKPYARWDEEKEGTFDRLGKFFLLTEMFRGMYVLMEQFFRPPYTIMYPFEKVSQPSSDMGCGG